MADPAGKIAGLACRLLVGPTSFTRRTMPVALAGRSPSTFEIKSASLPLLALRLKSSDLDALAQELHAHYGEMPDFLPTTCWWSICRHCRPRRARHPSTSSA
jgi:hypothetical protein